MGNDRVHVRAPISTAGLMILAVLLGIAVGGCAEAMWSFVPPFAEWASPADPWPLANRLENCVTIGALLTLLAMVVAVALSTPRIHLVAAAATLLWVAAFISVHLVDYYAPPYSALALRAPETLAADLTHRTTELLVGSLLAALGASIVARATHRLLVRPVEQDGTLCWRCAYPMERSGSSRCPECGAAIDDGAIHGQWMQRLASRIMAHRRVVTVAVAIILVGAIGRIAFVEIEFVRFFRTFDPAWPLGGELGGAVGPRAQMAWGDETAMAVFDFDTVDDSTWGWVTISLVRRNVFAGSRLIVRLEVAFAVHDQSDWSPRFPVATFGRGRVASFLAEPPPDVRRSIRRDGVSAQRLAAWRDRAAQLMDPEAPDVSYTVIEGEWWLDWNLLEPGSP